MFVTRELRCCCALLLSAGLAGCGGGDDASLTPLESSSALAAQCVAPRPASAIDPFSDPAAPRFYNDRQGTAAIEKAWVRSFIDETYLWYDEVPNFDPASFATAPQYFEVLKTPLVTPSGRAKDEFHFALDTASFAASSVAGSSFGYGMELAVDASGAYLVAYTEPNSPAAANVIARGAQLIAIDNVAIASLSDAALGNALFPSASGQSHSFTLRDRGATATRTFPMTSTVITRDPVQNVSVLQTQSGNVGYMLFNDHNFSSEADLVAAIDSLKATATISDLVLDIRYNGGGFLDIASELAFMIAGPSRTSGKAFEQLLFNRKNPFGVVPATPFHATTQDFSLAAGQPLPHLGLSRVFVLTSADTCSASESIINGLRGIDVQVVQIGATTCGKPFGFFPEDNCSVTYFAVQFQGLNAKGFGDYADGFVPGSAAGNGLPGCVVGDDFTRELGDPAEARLSAALTYRETGACPVASGRELASAIALGSTARLRRGPERENRFLRR